MHHLFCGIGLEPLSHYPFEAVSPGLQVFEAAELGWSLPGNPAVRFLPCLGSFVGSDILAGLLATKLHESERLAALIDLGTNGEIVVGNRERMLCASTAAGPAFEGARISMGMRAATGAISEVRVRDGGLQCHVLGNVAPRGICGSGLVDAVAAGLELGWISSKGRLANGDSLALAGTVSLNQWDVREVQLAKGAIAAGLRILLEQWGATKDDLAQVFLAGAFGNYINYSSARRIGLLDFPAEKVRPAGNTALLGAKLALFSLPEHDGAYPQMLAKVKHVSLNEDARFQETFVEEMVFPGGRGLRRRGGQGGGLIRREWAWRRAAGLLAGRPARPVAGSPFRRRASGLLSSWRGRTPRGRVAAGRFRVPGNNPAPARRIPGQCATGAARARASWL